ncbi:hypothetical protein [Terribacillus sp. 7520-G]|uniref:hypothetical protein n=1 Tax=Terribacillus TaxID=459532 RepID=UPI000BA73DA8|nr:hypothetical protein [Terribacillus sp. 7520-G]PAD38422.1 hypothetical protein CHH53_11005 [Terribacillus sp. 7520-G]
MSIHVKRNTGMMGGLSKVDLIVDGQRAAKLANSENTTVTPDEGSVKLQAKQWFFGSKELEVNDDAHVEVRINMTALFLLLVALVCLILGVMITPLLTAAAGVLLLVCIIYGSKNWFQLIKVE